MAENDHKLFGFNLLPRQTEEEIQQLEDRDNTILYSVVLIFAAVFIFFVLSLVETIFVGGRISTLEDDIATLDSRIDTYNSIRSMNGELVEKSRLLQNVLLQDIKLSEFLDISTFLAEGEGNILVYQRQTEDRTRNNEFLITVEINSYVNALNIYAKATNLDTIENVRLNRIYSDDFDKKLKVEIKFEIII